MSRTPTLQAVLAVDSICYVSAVLILQHGNELTCDVAACWECRPVIDLNCTWHDHRHGSRQFIGSSTAMPDIWRPMCAYWVRDCRLDIRKGLLTLQIPNKQVRLDVYPQPGAEVCDDLHKPWSS